MATVPLWLLTRNPTVDDQSSATLRVKGEAACCGEVRLRTADAPGPGTSATLSLEVEAVTSESGFGWLWDVHVPTNTVVACQNERSQHANKDTAMKMLRAKLYELEMMKRTAASQALEDSKSDIGWGHQIRSYVLDDSRIKDLRTGVERSDCQKVLDGDLDQYLEASLKQGL